MSLSRAKTRLSRQEMLILKALVIGRPVRVSSTQRLRLEMMGLTRDGPAGLEVLPEGLKLAANWQDELLEKAKRPNALPATKANGRRKSNQRR